MAFTCLFQHTWGRATTTVTVTVQQQTFVRHGQVLMAANPFHEFGIVALRVVCVGRCHVREYLGAVYTAPVKCRVGEGVDVIPRKLSSGIDIIDDSPFG